MRRHGGRVLRRHTVAADNVVVGVANEGKVGDEGLRTHEQRRESLGQDGDLCVGEGGAPDANALPISKDNADRAFDAAACIGCGACVAACPNASAMLFVGAKVTQFASVPQGQPERTRRVRAMVAQMDAEGFGNCTNHYECEAVCPKEIKVSVIAQMNRDLMKAAFSG